jgi:hypothetical protein
MVMLSALFGIMEEIFGTKELYGVTLKAIAPTRVGARNFEANEVILRFDKVTIAALNEPKMRRYARGGALNTVLIGWENVDNIQFMLSQGKFSKLQFGALINAQMVTMDTSAQVVPLTQRLESDSAGHISLKFPPIVDGTLFIYNEETGERINTYTLDGDDLELAPYTSIIIDYTFHYSGNGTKYRLGTSLINGFVKLEGKMRFKNEKGSTQTGILIIPKFKLMSDLGMALGNENVPMIGTLRGVGYASGNRNEPDICSIIWLDQEINGEDLI